GSLPGSTARGSLCKVDIPVAEARQVGAVYAGQRARSVHRGGERWAVSTSGPAPPMMAYVVVRGAAPRLPPTTRHASVAGVTATSATSSAPHPHSYAMSSGQQMTSGRHSTVNIWGVSLRRIGI